MYNEWIGRPGHLGRLKPVRAARFRPEVRREIGQALYTAQQGESSSSASWTSSPPSAKRAHHREARSQETRRSLPRGLTLRRSVLVGATFRAGRSSAPPLPLVPPLKP